LILGHQHYPHPHPRTHYDYLSALLPEYSLDMSVHIFHLCTTIAVFLFVFAFLEFRWFIIFWCFVEAFGGVVIDIIICRTTVACTGREPVCEI
jgi:uncharacterized membrane protein